jgi:uncharacterized protein (TIGR02588 family)
MKLTRKWWLGLGLSALVVVIVAGIMSYIGVSAEKAEVAALSVTSSRVTDEESHSFSIVGTVANNSSSRMVTDRYVVVRLKDADNSVVGMQSWHIGKLGPGQEQDFSVTFTGVASFSAFTSSGGTYEVSIA